MTWQATVIIVAVLAMCCFYRWCSVKTHDSNTHRIFAETQLKAQQMQHEQFRVQHGIEATND